MTDLFIRPFRPADLATLRRMTVEAFDGVTLDEIGQHLYPACGFVEVARQVHFARRL